MPTHDAAKNITGTTGQAIPDESLLQPVTEMGFREASNRARQNRRKSAFVTGCVTLCDGFCDGLTFCKSFSTNKCDGVTAQNPWKARPPCQN